MDSNIQDMMIKKIVSLAKRRKEEVLAELMVALSQCIEKNIQLITLYKRLNLFPKLVKEIEPYTGLKIEDLRPFCEFDYLVPTTPEEIILLDQTIRNLLCCSKKNNKKDNSSSSGKGNFPNVNHKEKINRLRLIITEQERIITVLRKRLPKADIAVRCQK